MENQLLNKIIKELSKDRKELKSIPFWSWNSDLDEDELIRQIYEMKEAGMGGFIIHARSGLKIQYLGDKWFYLVKKCLEKATELNMKVWIYDENGYPSGFAGGKLLENIEFRANYLSFEEKKFYDNTAYCVFTLKNGIYNRVFESEKDCNKFYCVYKHISPANTDILNPDVINSFIKLTHEEYYKRFKKNFGKELVGFFTDEPQLYRYATPYSKIAKEEYYRLYNENLDDKLIYLFNNDENGYEFRVKYFSLLNKLYVNNFYKKIYDWCQEHNCKLTGHSVEETSLYTQMWGGVV